MDSVWSSSRPSIKSTTSMVLIHLAINVNPSDSELK